MEILCFSTNYQLDTRSSRVCVCVLATTIKPVFAACNFSKGYTHTQNLFFNNFVVQFLLENFSFGKHSTQKKNEIYITRDITFCFSLQIFRCSSNNMFSALFCRNILVMYLELHGISEESMKVCNKVLQFGGTLYRKRIYFFSVSVWGEMTQWHNEAQTYTTRGDWGWLVSYVLYKYL
jgi:hypothetical protein